MWKDIIDQSQAVSILQRSITNNRVAHAYLFAGPRGVGKKKVALQMAKVLFCSYRQNGDNCEQCIDCQRINHDNHPDLHVIEPEGASIKIEQIRNLRKEFQYQAVESKRKVYILFAAETMTIPAANSLLKFLEEPTGEVTAILITSNPHSILPTIRSRCQLIHFQEMPWQKVAEQATAQGVSAGNARVATQIAKNLEAVLELCQSEVFAQLRKIVIQFYQEDFSNKAKVLLQLQNKILLDTQLKDEALLFIELSLIWHRDQLQLLLGKEYEVANVDVLSNLKEQAEKANYSRIANKIEILLQTQNRLKSMNSQLALEQMVMQLADVHVGKRWHVGVV